MTGPFASLSLYVVRVRLFRSCSTFTKNVTYQNSCSKLRYFSNLHIYLKSISETICYYLLQSLVVRSHYQERWILLSCPCSPAEKNHNCCGTWAQITKSTQASGAIFEETFIERFFPHLKLHFAARWCKPVWLYLLRYLLLDGNRSRLRVWSSKMVRLYNRFRGWTQRRFEVSVILTNPNVLMSSISFTHGLHFINARQ